MKWDKGKCGGAENVSKKIRPSSNKMHHTHVLDVWRRKETRNFNSIWIQMIRYMKLLAKYRSPGAFIVYKRKKVSENQQ